MYEVDTTGQTIRLIEVEGVVVEEVWVGIEKEHYLGKYQISNYGRVKSLSRVDAKGITRKEKLLRWRINRGRVGQTPYYHVMLNNKPHGNNYKIHRLVAEHFVEGQATDLEVNHIDGYKCNNVASNLEWITRSKNVQHAHDNKLTNPVTGHRHGRQKLTETEVRTIYITHMRGKPRESFNARQLGRDYGVDGRGILNIYRKEAWKWLTDAIDLEFSSNL